MSPLAFMPFNLGGWELLLISFLLLLFFGNRLPSVMRSMGRGVTEFKKGINSVEDEIDRASIEAEKKATAAPPVPTAVVTSTGPAVVPADRA